MALRGRRINNFLVLGYLVSSRGLEIWVSSTSFQKSNKGWPQKPLIGKVLNSNIIFYDPTQKLFFSKYLSKAEFKNVDDFEVLRSDFPVLTTSAASMTSTTSMASMTSTASFYQKTSWTWWLDHHWYPNDQYWLLFVEWIIKNPIFYWYLIFFLL